MNTQHGLWVGTLADVLLEIKDFRLVRRLKLLHRLSGLQLPDPSPLLLLQHPHYLGVTLISSKPDMLWCDRYLPSVKSKRVPIVAQLGTVSNLL